MVRLVNSLRHVRTQSTVWPSTMVALTWLTHFRANIHGLVVRKRQLELHLPETTVMDDSAYEGTPIRKFQVRRDTLGIRTFRHRFHAT